MSQPSSLENLRVEDLAARAAAGSSAAFEILVGRYQDRLLAFFRKRPPRHVEPEDLLQQTLLQAYRNLGRYCPQRPFEAWLFAVAANVAATAHRRVPREQSIEAGERIDIRALEPAAVLANREERAGLWALAAELLSPEQYLAIYLRYAEDRDVRSIAESLDKRPMAVKVMLHRARRKLLQCWPARTTERPRPEKNLRGDACGVPSTER